MVQTITMNEATLVDGMAKFVAEDLSSLDGEANWWHQRVRLVEHWLRDETSRVIIPDDGTDEMIRRHIQRGDSYPRSQFKCWKHIVMELRDLPCFAGVIAQTKTREAIARVNASPSRGKLRPGKDLIVLSDDKSIDSASNASSHGDDESNNASSSWSLEPLNPEIAKAPKKPRPVSSAAYLSRRELGIDTVTAASMGKSFAGMSLLERQMEWLRKKHDKMEAERLRQTEESERELTFQPKLIRRITHSGDRCFRETPGAPVSSRSFTRSESSRRVGETGGALLKERTLPKVPRLSHQRRAKKKTLLQSASISQPVGVSCKLLDSMKSELQASLCSARTSEADMTPAEQQESEAAHSGEDITPSSENSDSSGEESQVPDTEVAPAEEEKAAENAPAWSTKPTIGGRRADFDSSETKVRLILQDASKFELSSMYRKTDRRAGRDGVALHVGRREDTLEEQVIAVLFDREKVTEEEAGRWWGNHQHRFAAFMEPQQPREEEAQ
ncbi:Eukaryotic translation initiation factor 3 subunit L [Phytophthora pseudosyringae]|uniref:Eukaryotic translation initiation factor 3 subunit L n=1 Tax=Phytophthora pseudosyringae TaxID=221518 RepID=A0A8T1W6P4_9STRA|nr:Eukaryotic translation initiation factor 3 subunit L [Phytophthora pseudosyringae]